MKFGGGYEFYFGHHEWTANKKKWLLELRLPKIILSKKDILVRADTLIRFADTNLIRQFGFMILGFGAAFGRLKGNLHCIAGGKDYHMWR